MSKEEKLMILQMVAEGKITPEQGTELLRAVGEGKPETPAVPAVPPAPAVPAAPKVTVVPREPGRQAEIQEHVQRSIERASRHAEEVAQRAATQASEWANRVAKQADDFAQRTSAEGDNLGRVLGESGANLGKVLGESGENLGKVIARIFGGNFGGGPQFEFHEEQRGELPSEGEIQVSLSTTNGRITVDTWDEKGYRLDVRETSNAATEEEAKQMVKGKYEFRADGLNLVARSNEQNVGFMSGHSIGFTLTVPRDRKASLNLSSSNGRITISSIAGTRLFATTANGRVEAENCNFADTEVTSANGRIEFDGRPGNFKAGTANGRIVARVGGPGEWKMNSANGRVEVEISKEPGIAYEVEASTVMGRIEVEGMGDAEVLIDNTKQKVGSRQYKARSRGFSDAALKASLFASTAAGRVTVKF